MSGYASDGSEAILPWNALGLAPEAAPRRFVLGIVHRPIVTDSASTVLVGERFLTEEDDDDPARPYRRPLAAAPGGLYDESIFGPLPRAPDGTISLAEPLALHPYDRPQARRFGRIVLPRPVSSPWSTRFLRGAAPRMFTELSVLPAGLRPTFARGDTVLMSDLTAIYTTVVNRVRRYARLLELAASDGLLVHEQEFLQRSVDALLVDGIVKFTSSDEDGDASEEWIEEPIEVQQRLDGNEVPTGRVSSLLERLRRYDQARIVAWLDVRLSHGAHVLTEERWPGDAHEWRALLLAGGLELIAQA